ncbi:MAG TPA: hypothetical protein VN642_05580 [Dongiaceae bacterium]|nr:hypothetical protein [Dongiaceae bacterium]
MRYLIVALAILAASASFSGTALSEEKSPGRANDYGQYKDFETKGMKDECLIVAKNCIVGSETVMQRAERLQREIDKGAAVYTPEELKSFQEQLNWIYSESIEFSGGV